MWHHNTLSKAVGRMWLCMCHVWHALYMVLCKGWKLDNNAYTLTLKRGSLTGMDYMISCNYFISLYIYNIVPLILNVCSSVWERNMPISTWRHACYVYQYCVKWPLHSVLHQTPGELLLTYERLKAPGLFVRLLAFWIVCVTVLVKNATLKQYLATRLLMLCTLYYIEYKWCMIPLMM